MMGDREWHGEVGIQAGVVPQTKSQAAAFWVFLVVKPAWFHIPKGESSLQPHSVTQCLPLGGFNLKLGRIWDDEVELTIHLPQVNLEQPN